MTVQELLGALFNVSLVLMIVATMVSAGFTTTFAAIGSVLSRWSLVLMVLVTALVLRPLVGWGLAELFNLDNPAFIAMVLAASVAGAPLGVKFVMGAKADLTTGAVFQGRNAYVSAEVTSALAISTIRPRSAPTAGRMVAVFRIERV